MTAKVSIIIPVYNGANYLAEAIQSSLDQDYENIEIVVVNDGSVDENQTRNIALEFKDKITYLEKKNGGVASALNYAIEHSTGEYISWLSHDDLYATNKVSKQMAKLEANGSPCVVFSAFATIDESGKLLHRIYYPELDTKEMVFEFLKNCRVHGCSLLIPKYFLITESFNTKLRHFQDYDLWIRLTQKYEFVYIDEILVYGRQHLNQDSVRLGDEASKEVDNTLLSILHELDDKNFISKMLGYKAGQFYHEAYTSYKIRGLSRCADWCRKKLFLSVLKRPKNIKKFIKVVLK
jgi:glycosyltransferase involved in cell wall biosynthesis